MTQSDPMEPQLRWRSTKSKESDQKFADGQDMTGDLDFTWMRYKGPPRTGRTRARSRQAAYFCIAMAGWTFSTASNRASA
jgi:hypothetical protein